MDHRAHKAKHQQSSAKPGDCDEGKVALLSGELHGPAEDKNNYATYCCCKQEPSDFRCKVPIKNPGYSATRRCGSLISAGSIPLCVHRDVYESCQTVVVQGQFD